MSEIENPVIYFDPVTKKKYSIWDVTSRMFNRRLRDRLLTRIMYRKGGKKQIIEIPHYYEVPSDIYDAIQKEFEILGGKGGEGMYEILESYPSLLLLEPVEGIDWSPVTEDMYHTKEYAVTPKEKKKLMTALRKKFTAKHPKIKHVIPKIYLHYRKRVRGQKRVMEKVEIKSSKFTTTAIRSNIVKELDRLVDIISYFYVVAERPSPTRRGENEYRTILGRIDNV